MCGRVQLYDCPQIGEKRFAGSTPAVRGLTPLVRLLTQNAARTCASQHPDNFLSIHSIKLSKSHTGEYLAESVQMIVEKFDIETKVHTQLIILSSLVLIYEIFLIFQIFGIVSNNASNNSSSCPTSRASLTGFDVLHMSSI